MADMTSETYILRTPRGQPAMAFDNLERAREAQAERQKCVGVKFSIYRQVTTEELVG